MSTPTMTRTDFPAHVARVVDADGRRQGQCSCGWEGVTFELSDGGGRSLAADQATGHVQAERGKA